MNNYVIIGGELYHYGIPKQRWGVRRFQNKDGSLTPAGKKRYGKMSDNQLQKELHKQVRQARADQSDWSNQWLSSKTIGEHSKAVQDKMNDERKKFRNSDGYKEAERKFRNLDKRDAAGEIDPDDYDKEFAEIQKSIYNPALDSSVKIRGKGREYVKEFLNGYGKELNIAYLKDLGYDEQTAKEFTERIIKGADKKMLN